MIRKIPLLTRATNHARTGSQYFRKKSWVFLGLGSNLAQPQQQLVAAVAAITRRSDCQLQACSSLYRSKALPRIENSQQNDFYNLVLSITTILTPRQLLLVAKMQESKQGRSFGAGRYADRPIDIDILLYNQDIVKEKGLTIPHPRLHERDFVLRPLVEIAPDLVLPLFNKSLNVMLTDLTTTFVLEVEPFEKYYNPSTTAL
jgi:2-amino-4-hydroxy-6-hydroxymethyldihydropteridine diphosphokinase